jgi:lipopolysaccharide transport protein LptA
MQLLKKQWMVCVCLLGILTLMPSFVVCAQPAQDSQKPLSIPQKNKDAPVTITADDRLEWDRAGANLSAYGNVQVTQDDLNLTADQLVASYDRDQKDQQNSLKSIQAKGRVHMQRADATLSGDMLDYNVQTQYAILTGKNLTLKNPRATITAQEKMTYDRIAGEFSAIGNARAIQDQNTITAHKFVAHMGDVMGAQKIKTIEAIDAVTIATPTEKITGDHGIYNLQTHQVEMTGNIVIMRDQNRLTGSRATVDLDRQISTLYGGQKTGRVQGTFYPTSTPSKTEDKK